MPGRFRPEGGLAAPLAGHVIPQGVDRPQDVHSMPVRQRVDRRPVCIGLSPMAHPPVLVNVRVREVQGHADRSACQQGGLDAHGNSVQGRVDARRHPHGLAVQPVTRRMLPAPEVKPAD